MAYNWFRFRSIVLLPATPSHLYRSCRIESSRPGPVRRLESVVEVIAANHPSWRPFSVYSDFERVILEFMA